MVLFIKRSVNCWVGPGGVHRGTNFLLLVLFDRGSRPSSVGSHFSAPFRLQKLYTMSCTSFLPPWGSRFPFTLYPIPVLFPPFPVFFSPGSFPPPRPGTCPPHFICCPKKEGWKFHVFSKRRETLAKIWRKYCKENKSKEKICFFWPFHSQSHLWRH